MSDRIRSPSLSLSLTNRLSKRLFPWAACWDAARACQRAIPPARRRSFKLVNKYLRSPTCPPCARPLMRPGLSRLAAAPSRLTGKMRGAKKETMMTHRYPANLPARTVSEPVAQGQARIYVACLSAYNSGHLHGVWIAVTTPEEMTICVQSMLAASPIPNAEEWAIHDYEGFEGARLSEYASFETVTALAEFVQEYGHLSVQVYIHFGEDLSQARAAFEDYAGVFTNAAEFAEQLYDCTGDTIPEPLRYYVDWQALARDMILNGEIIALQTSFDETHIFWNR